MAGQNDWWLYPPSKVEDITVPLGLRIDTVEATLESYLKQPQSSRIKSAPTLEAGILVTAHTTAWKLGDLSAAILPAAVYEIVLLTIDDACGINGNVVVTLDGQEYTVALTTASDNSTKVATAIETALNAIPAVTGKWTLSRTTNVITFTADDAEHKTDAIYDSGATLAVGSMVTTQLGYGDLSVLIRRISFESMSDAGVYEIVLYADDVREIARVRVTQDAGWPLSGDVAVESPVLDPGTEIKARCAFSGGGASKTVRIALIYQDFEVGE